MISTVHNAIGLVMAFLVFVSYDGRIGSLAFAQDSVNLETSSDSLTASNWDDETYYQIEMLRLNRWLREHADELDAALLQEITRLKKEASDYAASGDFALASLWIETLWGLIEPGEETPSPDNTTAGDYSDGVDALILNPGTPEFSWSKQVLSGVDLWRQQFELAFIETDSTFIEGNGNPFSGIRFDFDHSAGYENSVRASAFFKYSRDYFSGDVNVRLRKPIGSKTFWRLDSRLEGTSFFREFDLRYIQNNSLLEFTARNLGAFELELEDRFLLRQYENQNNIYPSYYDNTLGALVKANLGWSSFLGVGYRNDLRLHPQFNENDYAEHEVESVIFVNLGTGSNLELENELTYRNYLHEPADPIYQVDYWEDYLRGSFRLVLGAYFDFETQGSLIARNYRRDVASTPDYLFFEIEPELFFKITPEWKIAGGMYFNQQLHQNTANASTDDLAIFQGLSFEDYYTFGPTLTIELFRLNGFLLSMQNSFLLQRYPNAPTGDIQSFNLYSDRNIYSVLLFLNWNVARDWQLNVLANIDDDRSVKEDKGDSQNTIISFEVGYSF